jgi:membrane protease YdiL (CAAX protease family)
MTINHSARPNPIRDTFVFFAITLGISYVVLWGPLVAFKVPVMSFVSSVKGPAWAMIPYIIGGFVPSLVALALTGIKEGRAGLKLMWQRMIQFKIGWRWYLVMVGLVILGSAGQIAFNYLFGHSFDFSLFLTQLPSFLPLILIGPLSEELGWRGYAQTRLQQRWNPLVTGLVVGMVWALWHLPLFLMIGTSQHELHMPFMGFFFGVTAISVLMAWLHNHTNGSIWTAIFFHWIYTFAGQVVATGVTRGALFNWLEFTPYILLAVVVVFVWGRQSKFK